MMISRLNCGLEDLAVAELRSIIEAYDNNARILFRDNCLLGFSFNKDINILKRLSLTKYIGKLIKIIDYNSLDSDINDIDIECKSYYIEGDYPRGYGKEYKWVKERIIRRIKGKIDYKNPEKKYSCIFTSRKIYLCEILIELKKKEYLERRPSKRPFSRPGAMDSITARAIVNLSRVKEGEKFLDAFCGTGSLLIEAALIGCDIYGFDLDKRMVEGCIKNLEYFGIKKYHVSLMDARDVGKHYYEYFDGIGSDLPYGRSTKIFGENLNKLYYEACLSLYDALKKGRYICLVTSKDKNLEDIMKEIGFKVEGIYYQYIHKSLTRKFVVGRKI